MGSQDASNGKPRWLLWWAVGVVVLLVGIGVGVGLVAWTSEPPEVDGSALLPTTPGWTFVDSEPPTAQTFFLGADETTSLGTLSLLIGALLILAVGLSGAVVLLARALHDRRSDPVDPVGS